jgi:hypothetical protein
VPATALGTPCLTAARCQCLPQSRLGATPAEQVATRRAGAAAVLLGRVVAVGIDSTLPAGGNAVRYAAPSEQRMVARIVALDWWKGAGTDTLTVVVRPSRTDVSSCDMVLYVDHAYLIFAERDAADRLHVAKCGGTRHSDDAAEVLPLLGPPLPRSR